MRQAQNDQHPVIAQTIATDARPAALRARVLRYVAHGADYAAVRLPRGTAEEGCDIGSVDGTVFSSQPAPLAGRS